MNLDKEENPALGFRAIRICLTRKPFFKKQLRALLRASAYGNLGIMDYYRMKNIQADTDMRSSIATPVAQQKPASKPEQK